MIKFILSLLNKLFTAFIRDHVVGFSIFFILQSLTSAWTFLECFLWAWHGPWKFVTNLDILSWKDAFFLYKFVSHYAPLILKFVEMFSRVITSSEEKMLLHVRREKSLILLLLFLTLRLSQKINLSIFQFEIE